MKKKVQELLATEAKIAHKIGFTPNSISVVGFFDSVLDRYADAAVYAAIIIAGLCNQIWGLAALAGSILVSYTRARAEAAGIKMESVGFAERAERMLILAAISIIAFWWLPALNYGIALLAVLSNLTVIQRTLHVYKTLKKKAAE